MIADKILVNVNNLSEVIEYKKIGISNFLFAVKDFSIGYNSFLLEEIQNIDANIYLLINRVMDTKSIEEFKENISKVNFVKGVFFEDMGVFNILKDSNIPLIFNQTQFATNTKSINLWLEKVDSVVLSNSLWEKEIIDIINNVSKPIVFNVFGKNMVMYSRRTLLSNFNRYMNLDERDSALIKETLKGKAFLVKEDPNGTVIFNDTYFNYMSLLDKINRDNVLFYYISNLDLKVSDIKLLLDGKFNNYDLGFLDKKTVFRVGDIND